MELSDLSPLELQEYNEIMDALEKALPELAPETPEEDLSQIQKFTDK